MVTPSKAMCGLVIIPGRDTRMCKGQVPGRPQARARPCGRPLALRSLWHAIARRAIIRAGWEATAPLSDVAVLLPTSPKPYDNLNQPGKGAAKPLQGSVTR